MESKVFKEFNFDRDVIEKSRVSEEELFYPLKGIGKPFSSGNGFNISEVASETDFEDYNSPVFYLEKTNSNITYLSTMRAESGSLDPVNGNVMAYRYMVSIAQDGRQSDYKIKESTPHSDAKKLDIICVSREFYKDGIDPDFFGIGIDTGGTSTTTSTYSDSDYDSGELTGLFPLGSEYIEETPIGKKVYLYAYNGGLTDFYDSGTDVFTMPDSSDLNTSQPYGEVYLDAGIIILYLNEIGSDYTSFDSGVKSLDYVGFLGGNSHTNLHSKIYFARLENEEFNYTTNDTVYEDKDNTILKKQFRRNPRTFPTSIGYYNDFGELVAVGKFSAPFEKNTTEEGFIRGELSY